jgi:hypothetical protein
MKNSTKKRKKRSTNMPRDLLKELQASIGRKRRLTKEQEQDQINNQQSTICAHSYCAAITFRFGSDSCKDFALQKNAQLLIRNIRDKLTSRRRNEDALLQELDRCYRKRGSPIRLCLSNKMQLKTKSHHLNSNLTRCKATSIVVTSA